MGQKTSFSLFLFDSSSLVKISPLSSRISNGATISFQCAIRRLQEGSDDEYEERLKSLTQFATMGSQKGFNFIRNNNDHKTITARPTAREFLLESHSIVLQQKQTKKKRWKGWKLVIITMYNNKWIVQSASDRERRRSGEGRAATAHPTTTARACGTSSRTCPSSILLQGSLQPFLHPWSAIRCWIQLSAWPGLVRFVASASPSQTLPLTWKRWHCGFSLRVGVHLSESSLRSLSEMRSAGHQSATERPCVYMP